MSVIIAAKPEHGFWRCGVKHSKAQTEYPDGRFTPEQLAILKAEPMLTVVEKLPVLEMESDATETAEKPAAGKKKR